MTKNTLRSATVTAALALVLMTPADAFTSGELMGISAGDGDGQAETSPWYRNTFVKLRAAGTRPVELPTRMPAKHTSVKPKRASQPAPAEVQLPETVKNLRRAG